jgi:glycolate oxidase FAD binding subunit
VVARAGTSLADLEARLAAEGQRLAFEPADWRGLLGTAGTPTVGGMAAANVSGPRRVQAGAARDAMLGVRFVDGTGAIVKNGGRVMKNVTGYDLVKLMAGSWGTLGVLTEVALKVMPAPEAVATLAAGGLDDARAVAAMAGALGSPYEVSGAAHVRAGGRCETLLRLEGFAGSVAYRAGALADRLRGYGDWTVLPGGRDPWRAVRDVSDFAGQPGDVWRLSVKPSDAPGIVARSGVEQAVYDWGGGLVWLLAEPGTDLRAAIAPFAGHATLMRASEETRGRLAAFQPEAPPVAALAAGLRARFDPRGLFNPGRMG